MARTTTPVKIKDCQGADNAAGKVHGLAPAHQITAAAAAAPAEAARIVAEAEWPPPECAIGRP